MDEWEEEDWWIEVSCELCGAVSYVYPTYPWEHRCDECDQHREYFWERYQIYEAGVERGIEMAKEIVENFEKNSEKS